MERNSFPVHSRALTAADASACDAIIRSLPYHFGDQNGVREAARAVRSSHGLVALLDDAVVGFLTIEPHFEASAEITWMAVHARHRGRGIGSALIERAKRDVAEEGRRVLLVTTLAASFDERDVADGYARTRAFYQARGFIPAIELPNLWPDHPALLLVLPLPQDGANAQTD